MRPSIWPETGRACSVLEARPQLGGRATAFADRETGELVDNGQHVLLGCYHATFRFLRSIGAGDHVAVQPALTVPFIDRNGQSSTLTCPPLPAPWHLLGGIAEWRALDWRDRIAALNMARPLRLARNQIEGGSAVAASPGETVENWLIRNRQTDRLREMLWDPLALAALNQSPTTAAAPTFARVLAEMFSGNRENAAIALPTRPLNLAYAEPARAFIEARGGEVRLNAPARVVIESGRAVHVVVQSARVIAPVVISAVPWHALGALLEGETVGLTPVIECATRMASSPLATVNLWLDRPILDVPFVGLPGRPLQWLFDKRLIVGGDTSHLTMVASGANDLVSLSNAELTEVAVREICDAIPKARSARIRRTTVVRERRGTFSLAPGQPERPGTRTAVPNFLLAGDWTDTGLPATIEGAARSGYRASEAAGELLGV